MGLQCLEGPGLALATSLVVLQCRCCGQFRSAHIARPKIRFVDELSALQQAVTHGVVITKATGEIAAVLGCTYRAISHISYVREQCFEALCPV